MNIRSVYYIEDVVLSTRRVDEDIISAPRNLLEEDWCTSRCETYRLSVSATGARVPPKAGPVWGAYLDELWRGWQGGWNLKAGMRQKIRMATLHKTKQGERFASCISSWAEGKESSEGRWGAGARTLVWGRWRRGCWARWNLLVVWQAKAIRGPGIPSAQHRGVGSWNGKPACSPPTLQ